MKTTIQKTISGHDENNKVVYTLGIEKGKYPNASLRANGATDNMDIHVRIIVRGDDATCCLHDVLEMILKDLEHETNYYEEEEEIGF